MSDWRFLSAGSRHQGQPPFAPGQPVVAARTSGEDAGTTFGIDSHARNRALRGLPGHVAHRDGPHRQSVARDAATLRAGPIPRLTFSSPHRVALFPDAHHHRRSPSRWDPVTNELAPTHRGRTRPGRAVRPRCFTWNISGWRRQSVSVHAVTPRPLGPCVPPHLPSRPLPGQHALPCASGPPYRQGLRTAPLWAKRRCQRPRRAGQRRPGVRTPMQQCGALHGGDSSIRPRRAP